MITRTDDTKVERGPQGLRVRRLLACVVATTLGALWLASVASAAAGAPDWGLHVAALPTRFSAADNANKFCAAQFGFQDCDTYELTLTNDGSVASGPSQLSDTLPSTLGVKGVSLFFPALGRLLHQILPLEPEPGHFSSAEVTENSDLFPVLEKEFGLCSVNAPVVQCFLPEQVAPDESVRMFIHVSAPEGTEALTDVAAVEGGASNAPTVVAHNQLGGPQPQFGVASFTALASGPDGRPETQAGGHPYEFTTRVDFDSEFKVAPDTSFRVSAVQDPRDVVVDLPAGFVGTALATPRCTFAEFSTRVNGGISGCPADTVVGHIFTEPQTGSSIAGPLYNMVPQRGEPAEFAFIDALSGPHVMFTNLAPSDAGYVLRTTVPEISQVPLTDVSVTFYGNPATKTNSGSAPRPLFTNPSACGEDMSATLHVDSWQNPGSHSPDGSPNLSDPRWVTVRSAPPEEGAPAPVVAGCDRLRFQASMSLQPDTTVADSPAGLDIDLKVPQPGDFNALATPPLRNAEVQLPAGVSLNPGAANGLAACSPAEIDLASADPPSCPPASNIGTVEVSSPLVPSPLHGSVFVASQRDNPFGTLFALYLVVNDPQTGVIAKIPGRLSLDPSDGRITTIFENTPQLPFSDLKVHLEGATHGVLATPEACGSYTASAQLSPWSAPDSGPAVNPFDSFSFDSGCVSGFSPSFTAGSAVPRAGSYTPLLLSFSRSDTDQELSSVSVTLPPGLLAKVSGVQRCSDTELAAAAGNPSGAAEMAAPHCPAASLIGAVTAGSGPGPAPIFVTGKAFLTGPYEGAPFGVAAVIPALAGPFDLGVVVVRSALHIDPTDGHVTVSSDPFPTMLNATGVPVRLKRVDISIDRPEFTFNPTSCEERSIGASFTSTAGRTSSQAARFQIGGCGELPFHPSFTAATSGRTSKLDGASLTVRVTQRPGEANIRKVSLQLPPVFPSRLTTLQKACSDAQFNQNPAGCPPGSNIGSATATTPILAVPLTGPAYLVSHGASAFPDVEFVLQGEGVRIILDGKTDIKKGITYSRFETVPDAPISSFETVLPKGPHSVLAALGNLCADTQVTRRRILVHHPGRTLRKTVTVRHPQALLAPTTITAQNGVSVHQNTHINVTGCIRPHARPRHHMRRHR
jgi:hypothetical protein